MKRNDNQLCITLYLQVEKNENNFENCAVHSLIVGLTFHRNTEKYSSETFEYEKPTEIFPNINYYYYYFTQMTH